MFVSQSTTSNRCLFEVWVGTAAGGDNSGIQVTESLDAPVDGCFTIPAGHIPDTINIGDALTNLTGRFINFCPSGSACPANTAQELDVTNGMFVVGAAGPAPTATSVMISDIAGTGLSVGPRGLALQGALVQITNTVIVDPPSAANHNVMTVAAMGTTTPLMPIQISKYNGVTCQRNQLAAMTAGASVGDITGMLQYSFGQWTIQPRYGEDLPGVVCMVDAGADVDAGP
jgi:hypothetical protein